MSMDEPLMGIARYARRVGDYPHPDTRRDDESVFGDLRITESSEALDGTTAVIKGLIRPMGICRITAGINLTMPSGRQYRVWQLRWGSYDGWGYPVTIDLERAE